MLEVAREAATDNTLGRRGEGDRPLNAAALSAWDYPKEEGQQFARFMVSVLSPPRWVSDTFCYGPERPMYGGFMPRRSDLCPRRRILAFSTPSCLCLFVSPGLLQIAAKVMQADLLRRLQEASASEADLRHVLRRRDIRIEDLKREQAVAGRLAMSSGDGGMPRSTLVDSFARSMDARQTAYAVGAIGGDLAADKGKADSAAERTGKEVALAAVVKRLELELAEAAARGDVGDAAVCSAERLAYRLFPDAAGADGEGGRKGECHLCGRLLKPERRDTSLSGSHTRGLSFLMPSTVVERKATGAGGEVDGPRCVEAAAQTMHTPTAFCDNVSGGENVDLAAVKSYGGNVAARPPSVEAHGDHDHGQSLTSVHTEDGEEAEHGDRVPVVSQGLSTGLRSIEAHLARLEAVAGGGFADGTDAADSRVRSSPPGGKSEAIEWALAQVVHDLRTQVAGLRDQAEVTAGLFNVSTERENVVVFLFVA